MGMLLSGSSASETPWQERDQSVQCINLHAESTLHNISVTLGISDGWKHYFSSFQGQNSQASLIRPKLRKRYGENRVGGLLTAKHCYCFLVLRKTHPFAITFFPVEATFCLWKDFTQLIHLAGPTDEVLCLRNNIAIQLPCSVSENHWCRTCYVRYIIKTFPSIRCYYSC